MNQLAEDVYQLSGMPPNLFNVYLMGGVLVDAGTRRAARRILRQACGRTVVAHALTHAHPDHQGSSRAVCEALDIPLWCGEADADAAEDPALILARLPEHWFKRVSVPLMMGPGYPVARRLREGDEVGGFRVIEAPGHTRGHVAFWRESDRVLLLGDVLASMNPFTGWPGLREPPRMFTPDPAANRRSARKLAALEPRLVCFGHGPPLRDTRRLLQFVAGLKVDEAV
jgi:glyoxylase-like metal-dependent hydrolase (beta-lactamase superfamily II)